MSVSKTKIETIGKTLKELGFSSNKSIDGKTEIYYDPEIIKTIVQKFNQMDTSSSQGNQSPSASNNDILQTDNDNSEQETVNFYNYGYDL